MIFAKSDSAAKTLVDTMLAQHEHIEKLLTIQNPTCDDVQHLVDALCEHIRFEEREIFTIAQDILSQTELLAIYEASDENVKNKR